jgi:RHS repeat-associated protein
VYFACDTSGQRVRKVWAHSGLVEERIYVGGWEVYRKRDASGLALERQTLHVMDGVKRVALVETTTADASVGGAFQVATVTRFQLGNHLGSSVLEVDAAGSVISYEEYHPYGTTAYHSGTGAAEVSLKRYRYTGKERDEETGLYYYGARYYPPWLGRWTSPDPAEIVDGLNLYRFVRGNPIAMVDPNGTDTTPAELMFYFANKYALRPQSLKDPQQDQENVQRWVLALRGYVAPTRAPSASPEDHLSLPARSSDRILTIDDYNEIVEKGRLVPGYGVGTAGAVALGQRDPEKIRAAGDYAASAFALSQFAAAAKASIEAKRARAQAPADAPASVPKALRPGPEAPKALPPGPEPAKALPLTATRYKYENLRPQDTPNHVWMAELVQEGGKWKVITASGARGTAKGTYTYVTMNGKVYVGYATGGPKRAGHIDLSGGDPVDYAGEVRFSKKGELEWWNNNSGHHRPEAGDALQAGLPMDKFAPLTAPTRLLPGPAEGMGPRKVPIDPVPRR